MSSRSSSGSSRGLLLAGLVGAATIVGCAQTFPQVYSQPFLKATTFRLGFVNEAPFKGRPAAIETVTPASGSAPVTTYSENPLQVTVTGVDGQIPTILYWILEIEGPGALTGDSTLSVFPEGQLASTESIYTFPLAKLAQNDAEIANAKSAFGKKRNYALKAVWENDLNQTNLTTTTRLTFLRADGTPSRVLNARDPKDAQVFLTGQKLQLEDNNRLADGQLDAENPVYPSAATATLLNSTLNNVRDTPTLSFELTSESTTSAGDE